MSASEDIITALEDWADRLIERGELVSGSMILHKINQLQEELYV